MYIATVSDDVSPQMLNPLVVLACKRMTLLSIQFKRTSDKRYKSPGETVLYLRLLTSIITFLYMAVVVLLYMYTGYN